MVKANPDAGNPQLVVHRSTQHIGGNCIEIAYRGHRIILDAGSTLDGTPQDTDTIPASLDTSSPVDAVIVSHPHQDHYRLPQMGWPHLRGLVTSGIKRLYERPDRLHRPAFIDRCCASGNAFSAAKIESGPRRNVAMLRSSLFRDYTNKGLILTSDDCWVFSMWSGYLDQPEYCTIRGAFDKAGARFASIHTSGHASKKDLQEFASSINARYLVPIHSSEWDQHVDGFENVRRLQDGEVFEIP